MSTADHIRKFIFYGSIVVIVFWLVIGMIRLFADINMTESFETLYEKYRFMSLPFAALLTMAGTIKESDSNFDAWSKFILTVIAAGLTLLGLTFISLANSV